MQGPKCGYEQADDSSECNSCSIVFSKWRQRMAGPPPRLSALPATVVTEDKETGLIRFDYIIARMSHGLGALLITAALAWGGFLLFKQYRNLGTQSRN